MTMIYLNHHHPTVKAAMITSNALRASYKELYSATSKKEKLAAMRACQMLERVHTRMNEILRNTPESWVEVR